MILLLIHIPFELVPIITVIVCFVISGIIFTFIDDLGRIALFYSSILFFLVIALYIIFGIISGAIWLAKNVIIT